MGARGVWSWGQSGSTLAKRTTAMKAKGVLVVSSDHQDWKNKLYFGDNLNVLREHVQDETADLIYLDPPFNSNATYNVLFREKGGEQSAAQITAFEDTWRWGLDKVLPSSSAPQGPRVLRGEALGAPGPRPEGTTAWSHRTDPAASGWRCCS